MASSMLLLWSHGWRMVFLDMVFPSISHYSDTYYSLSLYPTVSMVRQTQFLYMFCFVLYHLISVMLQWRGARKLRHTVLMCLFTGLFPNGYNLAQVVWRCVQNMYGRNGVELSLGFGLIFRFGLLALPFARICLWASVPSSGHALSLHCCGDSDFMVKHMAVTLEILYPFFLSHGCFPWMTL